MLVNDLLPLCSLAGKDAVATCIYTVQPAVGGVTFQPPLAQPPVPPVILPPRKLFSLLACFSVFRHSCCSAPHAVLHRILRVVGLATLLARLLSGLSLASGVVAAPWAPWWALGCRCLPQVGTGLCCGALIGTAA